MSVLRSTLRLAFVVAFAVPVALSASACAPGKKPVQHANVQAGDMPADGDWNGVYFSTLYGNLHLVKDGNNVNGRWRTAAGDKWGELAGTVTGNLLRFEWKEHTIGLVGANATRKGRGYFMYTVPNAKEAHVIKGGWGLGEDETGSTWEAVKQKDKLPDLKSVAPDEYESTGQGGGWD